jgi:HK97 family phage prohead protease
MRRRDGSAVRTNRADVVQRSGLDVLGPLTRFGPSAVVTPTGLLERRSVRQPGLVEIRAEGDDDESWTIGGHSVVFDVWTEIGYWWRYREKIAKGAASKTIAEGDIRSCFNHDPTWLLGRTKSGTHRLSEDDIGVAFETDLDPTDPHAQSLRSKVKRGDVDGCSFWFEVLREEWTYADDENGLEMDECVITEFRMFEDGPVTFPAYEETDVSARTAELFLRSVDVEPERAASLAAEMAADPVRFVECHRDLLTRQHANPTPPHPSRAAEEAPGTESDRTPPSGHLRNAQRHMELLSARTGLPITRENT